MLGDLDEQFARGRSPAWYWRQVLSAIAAGVARDIRDHKLRALGAAILTGALVIVWVESTWALYLWIFNKWVYARAATQGSESTLFFRFWVPYGAGLQVVWCAGCAAAGWLNARLQREHAATIIVVTIAAELPLVLWLGLPLWLRVGNLPATYSIPIGACALAILIGMPAATLIGAVYGARVSPRSLRSLR